MENKELEKVVEIKINRYEKEGKVQYMVYYRTDDKTSNEVIAECEFIPSRREHKVIVREALLATVEEIYPD